MGKSLAGKTLPQGISQRKDGRYFGRYTDKFGKRRCVYGKTVKEVKEKMSKALQMNAIRSSCYENITMNEWYEVWINTYVSELSMSTNICYEVYYRKHVADYVGWRNLNDIRPIDIKELFATLSREGLGISTISGVKGMLSGMFRCAEENEYVYKNPVHNVRLPKARDKRQIRALTREEQNILLNHCGLSPYGDFIRAQISSGLRCGELSALQAEDVDFDKRQISVNKTLSYHKNPDTGKMSYSLTPPKTKNSVRKVPMTSLFEAAVKHVLMKPRNATELDTMDVGKLLFLSERGYPITPITLNLGIHRLVNTINDKGFYIPKFSSHCLRHTYCTRLIETGVNPKVVQKIMGHSNIRITLETYSHVNDDFMDDVRTEIEDLF